MLKIKRLYTFMLQTFLPVFAMTFFICLFIVLMQFLWRYVDDLVGKGLEISVIAELFFYAALTMVPMALPLAILLASLMTFGNLGEKFELTAMKASGVSLMRTMRPLIVLIAGIAVGAFFFQNYALPVAQTKMWTLLFSVRHKSPEMEIPERVFYDQIEGLQIFVEEKDRETGMLYDPMIYDMSGGIDNTRIIVADSARIDMTNDRRHLLFTIYEGEQFENLRQSTAGIRSSNLPYRRESFDLKEIVFTFDANFNRMDESNMRRQYVGKNIAELRATIDSVNHRVDSIGAIYGQEILQKPYFSVPYYDQRIQSAGDEPQRQRPIAMEEPLDIDSLFNRNPYLQPATIVAGALQKAERISHDYEYKSYSMEEDRKQIRRHDIELHKKFTLSIACLIFFFIGAPLGAIIRKGGIGMPLVVSVILFIIYYIIDNTGYKMARDGHIAVWQGMWLSSAILLPLGIFLTYKAVHDSAVFNLDAYKAFILKLRGKHVRTLELKEFVIEEVEPEVAEQMVGRFAAEVDALANSYRSAGFFRRLKLNLRPGALYAEAQARMNDLVGYLSNSRDMAIITLLNRLPFDLTPRNAASVAEVCRRLAESLRVAQNQNNS